MGRSDYAICKRCHRHRDEAGTMSYTRLCSRCGHELLEANIDGLHEKTGYPWLRWREAMAACVGAKLPDRALDGSQLEP